MTNAATKGTPVPRLPPQGGELLVELPVGRAHRAAVGPLERRAERVEGALHVRGALGVAPAQARLEGLEPQQVGVEDQPVGIARAAGLEGGQRLAQHHPRAVDPDPGRRLLERGLRADVGERPLGRGMAFAAQDLEHLRVGADGHVGQRHPDVVRPPSAGRVRRRAPGGRRRRRGSSDRRARASRRTPSRSRGRRRSGCCTRGRARAPRAAPGP